MATTEAARQSSPSTPEAWYALDAAEVIAKLGVVVGSGLSAGDAAGRLKKDGPNELPVEQPPSPLHRFLAQYTSYMQIILVGAAIVSLVIKQWTTAIVLIVITLFNALVGLRQEGKAESAMNALQSMMKATRGYGATVLRPRSRPNSSWLGMSCWSRRATRCPQMGASCPRARSRSTNRR